MKTESSPAVAKAVPASLRPIESRRNCGKFAVNKNFFKYFKLYMTDHESKNVSYAKEDQQQQRQQQTGKHTKSVSENRTAKEPQRKARYISELIKDPSPVQRLSRGTRPHDRDLAGFSRYLRSHMY